MTADANSFLMGSGGRSATFPNVKDMVWGTIVSFDTRQQTAIGSNEPMFWKDGSPRLQLVITLQTDKVEDDEDDGVRKVYAKGQMIQAIRKAVTAAGERGLANGGKLAIQYVKDGERTQAGFNAPKVYGAKYEPPVYSQSYDDPEFANDDTPPLDDEDMPF